MYNTLHPETHVYRTGLTEPVGTGPETVGTGPTGSGSGRFPTNPNSKFEFEFEKWNNLIKFSKILQGVS
jgi:hypothetical protein